MKTIEERAFQYIEKQCKGCRNEEKKGRYFGFIQGATEQKAIDDAEHTEEMRQLNEEWKANLVIQREMLIDKSWNFLKELIDEDANDGYCEKHIITKEQYRKAMEE